MSDIEYRQRTRTNAAGAVADVVAAVAVAIEAVGVGTYAHFATPKLAAAGAASGLPHMILFAAVS